MYVCLQEFVFFCLPPNQIDWSLFMAVQKFVCSPEAFMLAFHFIEGFFNGFWKFLLYFWRKENMNNNTIWHDEPNPLPVFYFWGEVGACVLGQWHKDLKLYVEFFFMLTHLPSIKMTTIMHARQSDSRPVDRQRYWM